MNCINSPAWHDMCVLFIVSDSHLIDFEMPYREFLLHLSNIPSCSLILPVPMPPLPTILLPTHDITTSVSRSPAVTVTPGNSCTMTSLRMSDVTIFLNSSITGSQLAFLCVWSHSWLHGSAIHYRAPLFCHGDIVPSLSQKKSVSC